MALPFRFTAKRTIIIAAACRMRATRLRARCGRWIFCIGGRPTAPCGVDFHNTQWRGQRCPSPLDCRPASRALIQKVTASKPFSLAATAASRAASRYKMPTGNQSHRLRFSRQLAEHSLPSSTKNMAPSAREAVVTIVPPSAGKTGRGHLSHRAEYDATAKTGVTLGGACDQQPRTVAR